MPDSDDRTTGTGTTATGTTGPDAERGGRRPWYRRPLPIAGMALGAVVLAGVAVFAYLWTTRGAREVTVAEQIERYRREAGSTEPSEFLRPATGVYVYEASGTERLSVLDTTQRWGPTMPASVTRQDDGCWTLRLDFSTNHWSETRYCPAGEELATPGNRGYQGFDLGAAVIGETSVFTCDPPVDVIRVRAEPGDAWPASCTGGSESGTTAVTSAGTNTFVGVEELVIGGTPIAALHYREERTLSGSQKGTGTTENWYSVTDGMLLRSTRTNAVTSPSPIGDVSYDEEGVFTLTSLRPTG
jgi:hypothetical protein